VTFAKEQKLQRFQAEVTVTVEVTTKSLVNDWCHLICNIGFPLSVRLWLSLYLLLLARYYHLSPSEHIPFKDNL